MWLWYFVLVFNKSTRRAFKIHWIQVKAFFEDVKTRPTWQKFYVVVVNNGKQVDTMTQTIKRSIVANMALKHQHAQHYHLLQQILFTRPQYMNVNVASDTFM